MEVWMNFFLSLSAYLAEQELAPCMRWLPRNHRACPSSFLNK